MSKTKERIEDRGWKIDGGAKGPGSILYLLSSILALFHTSCGPVGAVTYKLVGEPPVPAQYVPDKTRPMLVLVENYRNPAAGRLDAQRVTLHVAEQLRRHRIAPVVDPEEAEALRARADYRAMKVQDVGAAAGAGQVLYVNLQPFHVDDTVGGDLMKARAEMRVRVVDVKTGQTLWPRETPEGYPVAAQSSWTRTQSGAREGVGEPALRDQVAATAANQIVRLFRKWRPEDEEQDLDETVH